MGFGIYSSIAGANAREIELEVIANNMANAQTTGFKEMNISFTSEVDKNRNESEEQKQQSLVREGLSHINYAQGSVYETGNPLDMAIQGEGFFEIQTPVGLRYTRNGNFSLTEDGAVVTGNGDAVMGTQGPLRIPAGGTIAISQAGDISIDGDNLGKIKVVDFTDRSKLKAEGNTYYSAEGSDFTTNNRFQVAQSHLESSNVDIIHNLTRMIEVSRAYEAQQKTLTKQIQASQQLNQVAKIG